MGRSPVGRSGVAKADHPVASTPCYFFSGFDPTTVRLIEIWTLMGVPPTSMMTFSPLYQPNEPLENASLTIASTSLSPILMTSGLAAFLKSAWLIWDLGLVASGVFALAMTVST